MSTPVTTLMTGTGVSGHFERKILGESKGIFDRLNTVPLLINQNNIRR